MITQSLFKITSIQGEDKHVHVDGPTSLEEALYAMLEEYEIEYQAEYNVQGYRVDAFAPEVEGGWNGPGKIKGDKKGTQVAFEADGPMHFTARGRKRDEGRDKNILASGKVDTIVRLDKQQLMRWL